MSFLAALRRLVIPHRKALDIPMHTVGRPLTHREEDAGLLQLLRDQHRQVEARLLEIEADVLLHRRPPSPHHEAQQ